MKQLMYNYRSRGITAMLITRSRIPLVDGSGVKLKRMSFGFVSSYRTSGHFTVFELACLGSPKNTMGGAVNSEPTPRGWSNIQRSRAARRHRGGASFMNSPAAKIASSP